MKLTISVFALLILIAWVWGGCKKSDNNTPTQTKNSTITHMSGSVAPVKVTHAIKTVVDNHEVALHDSIWLPPPVYYVGRGTLQGECSDQYVNSCNTDTIIIKWISTDSLFIGRIYYPNSNNTSISYAVYAGMHTLSGYHLPMNFEVPYYHNDLWLTFQGDSLKMHGSLHCSCLEDVNINFKGIKTNLR